MRRVRSRLPRRLGVIADRFDQDRRVRLRHPVVWGNLRRQEGFAIPFAEGRGGAVDRVYIERFLSDHRRFVRGRVLEVRDATYAHRFGHSLLSVDVLDIDQSNPHATLIADLGTVDSLPSRAYDCMVVTQTIYLIPNMRVAMANLRRALDIGGTLLLTAPVLGPATDPVGQDAFRVTPLGLRHLTAEFANEGDDVEVVGLGNRVASIAFLTGMAIEDLRPRDIEFDDELCPLIACLRLTRLS